MNIQIKLTTRNPIQLWRVPHDVERYDVDGEDFRYAGDRVGVVRKTIRDAGVVRPEIYRAYPDHTTPIDKGHQFLWKNINPELSNGKWATLLGNHLAWTNDSGFPGRADYVNLKDLDQGLPTFHATLVNGGWIFEGEEDGNRVWIKNLLISQPTPLVDDYLNSRMWSYGTSVIPSSGDISMITRLGIDGTPKKVRIPFFTKYRVYLPKDELHKLSNNFLPPPNWIVGD